MHSVAAASEELQPIVLWTSSVTQEITYKFSSRRGLRASFRMLTSPSNQAFHGIAFHAAQQTLYYSAVTLGAIYQLHISSLQILPDSTGGRVAVSGLPEPAQYMAIDEASNILVVSTGSSLYKVMLGAAVLPQLVLLVDEGSSTLGDIALDINSKRAYYTAVSNLQVKSVGYATSVNGIAPTTHFSAGASFQEFVGIAIDLANNMGTHPFDNILRSKDITHIEVTYLPLSRSQVPLVHIELHHIAPYDCYCAL